eukprot:jgi/Mesen1/8879/ME000532S08273
MKFDSGSWEYFVALRRQLLWRLHVWIGGFVLCIVLSSYMDGAAAQCTKESNLVGFRGDLSMVQHQLRGTIEIIDDCTFKVTKFDMLLGEEVYWWGAESDSVRDMLAGWPVSRQPLVGTFNSQTLEVTLDNTTWDEMSVLSVWSQKTASDYGHVALSYEERLEEPFAEDYFVTAYQQCDLDKKEGVCPDAVLAGSSDANNVRLIYGQRVDGVTLIRYQRPLESPDTAWDHSIDVNAELSIIWAMGPLLKPEVGPTSKPNPDSNRMFPSYHGSPPGAVYGMTVLTLGDIVDDCQSVLAPASPDAGTVLVADRGVSFAVTAGDSVRYPNPPSPGKSLYINGHEAPVLKVERGVPVQFSIQAGHDTPFYVTSDPVGGNTNPNETIYTGGLDAHGAFTQPKMGWQVQVVDGGLSDMYTHSAPLADNRVTLFWTLTATDIAIAVRGERPSGWLSIGIGSSGMVNSFAYVGYFEEEAEAGGAATAEGADSPPPSPGLGQAQAQGQGGPGQGQKGQGGQGQGQGQGGERQLVGKVGTYWIDGRDASNVHPWPEEIVPVKVASQGGMMTFEFSRPLKPVTCGSKCNVIDPSVPLKVVWAFGATWTSGTLGAANMHAAHSQVATVVDLQKGEAVEEHLEPVHGFMMFISWGVLLPFGVLAARIHLYTQAAGISVMILGLLFAMGELQGFDFSTTHSKVGITAILLGLWQPLNAYFRPAKPTPPERPRLVRVIWQWAHLVSGRAALVVGAVALMTGIVTLGEESADDYTVTGLAWGMSAWLLAIGALVVYNEYLINESRKKGIEVGSSASFAEWRNGGGGAHSVTNLNDDEDDLDDASRDLLAASSRDPFHDDLNLESPASARGMEVELEALR